MKVVILTGLSGAGRSRAADWFEDQGYYCVDNLPPALIDNFLELTATGSSRIEKVCFVTDVRGRNFFEKLSRAIDRLREDKRIDLKVIFMEAAAETIVKRYSEVRRNHPLGGGPADVATIQEEQSLLEPIRSRADFILDTTGLKVSQLNLELDRIIQGGLGQDPANFHLNISSFGFKYGIPQEVDVLFDMRFLQNPYYVPSLRKLTGNNRKIVDFVFKDPLAKQFVDSIHVLLNSLIPGYIKEGKYHLNIAFGCTGGHHRSVAIANEVADRFKQDGLSVFINHRDLDMMTRGK